MPRSFIGADQAPYCSSVTCSIQSTTLPLSASWHWPARQVLQLAGEADDLLVATKVLDGKVERQQRRELARRSVA